MRELETRCRNCGTQATSALCAPCEQDRLLAQASLEQAVRRGLRCID